MDYDDNDNDPYKIPYFECSKCGTTYELTQQCSQTYCQNCIPEEVLEYNKAEMRERELEALGICCEDCGEYFESKDKLAEHRSHDLDACPCFNEEEEEEEEKDEDEEDDNDNDDD